MRSIFAVILLMSTALSPSLSDASEPDGDIFIHAGALLADPATGTVATGKTIIVRGKRIVAIEDGYVGDAERVIDLRTSFVMPGLIDSHVHLLHEDSATSKMDRVTRTAADLAIAGVHFAGLVLRAGFTTVADVGDENDGIFALRDGIASGKIAGPRIHAAGNVISPHGGEGDVYGYRTEVIRAIQRPNLCSGADDCRRVVRQQVQRGADFIKITATGAVLSDAALGVDQQFTDDELKAIVETAHALGRKVTAHAHSAGGVNAFLAAGGDSIEHGTFLDARSVAMMQKNGTYLVPTLLAGETVTGWGRDPDGFLSPEARAKALLVGPKMSEMARRAHAGGVRIAFGTDSSVSPHGTNAREFRLLVGAGLTSLEALQSATVNAAEHLGLDRDIGSIEPGKFADIIATPASPLADIGEMENVRFVMKEGRVFLR